MAADYDWNFFIVLSGTIDNLRKQTRDRFRKDLQNSEGVLWRVLDFTSEDRRFGAENLKLNPLSGSKNFSQRYVTVCLKNRKRLENLIDWLYEDPKRTCKLRVVVIDDEADQASINTAEITPEEEQERCAINQLICNLVNGKKSDGSSPETSFQAMNYVSYTATPYANAFMKDGIDSFSFPDGMTDGQKYKQFGNSVAIPVIEELANFMLKCFEKMNNSQTSIVCKLASENEYITKRDVIESLRISVNQANYLLKKMVANGNLRLISHGRHSKYKLVTE